MIKSGSGPPCPGAPPWLRRGRALAWLGATSLAILLLALPALWNGFPLLQHDTGGYFARWHEGTLYVSRAVPYGLLLNLGAVPDFWPVVVVQGAATVWLIAVALRVHGLHHPAILAGTIAVLVLVTALPWLVGILLTDIFAGLAVLALYLVGLRGEALSRKERIGLTLFAGYGAATHSATLAVLVALLALALLVRAVDRRLVPAGGLRRAGTAIALSIVFVLASNLAVAGRLAWTPGGVALSFGRMLQDGIVARYLAEQCPDPRLRLCAHRSELPQDADDFFWSSPLFDRLGRFEGLGREMEIIAMESLLRYPLLQLRSAVRASLRQLVSVRTGEGVVHWVWNTYGMIELYAPAAVPAMRAARQQRGGIGFGLVNAVHVPVALGSMILLLGLCALALRHAGIADLAPFFAATGAALVANAVICGVLANPHDRYGARMAWLATFAVVVAAWRFGLPRLASPRNTC